MTDGPEIAKLPIKNEFSEWYNELLWMAEIMDVRYPVKGLYVWYPFGFNLRSRVTVAENHWRSHWHYDPRVRPPSIRCTDSGCEAMQTCHSEYTRS